jgi:eukaryotic-like serine/threonine-protein kinase
MALIRSRNSLHTRFVSWGKLTLLACVLATVFFTSMIIGMRVAVRGHEIQTPSLLGMTLTDAQSLFSRLELNLVVAGKRYDATAPEGAIISQVPGPGIGVKANRNVRIIVSLGRRTHAVPDLRGRSLRAARMVAEQSGYEIGRISEMAVQGGKDEVAAQWPPPQAHSGLDDRIDLLLERPAVEVYVMPEFIGQNMNRVLIFLADEEFESKVYYRDHPGVRRGTVVRQYPEPGFPVKKDEIVNLEVAR